MSEQIKPQRGEDWVRIEFWKCNVIGHRHRTPKSAAACIMKRKGEAGELKKLKRNLSMIKCLRSGETLVEVSKRHHCSDSNVTKAVNSTLRKAWKFAAENGGCIYDERSWRYQDFTDSRLRYELDFLVNLLQEMEVKLESLTK